MGSAIKDWDLFFIYFFQKRFVWHQKGHSKISGIQVASIVHIDPEQHSSGEFTGKCPYPF